MYYILGHAQCPNCVLAKELLDKRKAQYVYVDLKALMGEDWRQIFKMTELWEGRTKPSSIPLIFNSKHFVPIFDQVDLLKLVRARYIGGLSDLQDILSLNL